jgi:hypothetical protein
MRRPKTSSAPVKPKSASARKPQPKQQQARPQQSRRAPAKAPEAEDTYENELFESDKPRKPKGDKAEVEAYEEDFEQPAARTAAAVAAAGAVDETEFESPKPKSEVNPFPAAETPAAGIYGDDDASEDGYGGFDEEEAKAAHKVVKVAQPPEALEGESDDEAYSASYGGDDFDDADGRVGSSRHYSSELKSGSMNQSSTGDYEDEDFA